MAALRDEAPLASYPERAAIVRAFFISEGLSP